MQIWENILQARQELNQNRASTVITIGNFDGVHRGHQQIIQRTRELARQSHSLAAVLTFKTHSDSLTGKPPLLLNTPDLRRALLARTGIDRLLEIEFDQQFAALEAENFFQAWIREALNAQGLVVGYDFHFGAGRRGDFQLLQRLGREQGIRIEQVPPVYEGGAIISSSQIRQLLAEGQINRANRMLGYNFVIEGKVVNGEKLGRKLGFPTANIHLESQYLLPRYGVYLVRLTDAPQSYFGIANVGIKPTFGQSLPLVEVYLFDVQLNLYERLVQVEFLKFIRPENRFSSPEALKKQIVRDLETAKGYLGQFRIKM
ncbi:MAG TPA: bifunctional riboflavin kinase/FAD synthetase [Bacillota bacterium]